MNNVILDLGDIKRKVSRLGRLKDRLLNIHTARSEDLRKVDLDIQDLLHAIEIDGLKIGEMAKLSWRLRRARKNRRMIKNDMLDIRVALNNFDKEYADFEAAMSKRLGVKSSLNSEINRRGRATIEKLSLT